MCMNVMLIDNKDPALVTYSRRISHIFAAVFSHYFVSLASASVFNGPLSWYADIAHSSLAIDEGKTWKELSVHTITDIYLYV